MRRRALMATPPDQWPAAIELLKRARELVARPGGWCGPHGRDEKGAVSATFALMDSDPENWLWHAVSVEMGHALPDDWHYLDRFEAAPGRTQADVVEAFDREIARREARAAA